MKQDNSPITMEHVKVFAATFEDEAAKAGKQLGGFYNPATSVKIPESFGTPSVIEPLKL